MKPLITIVIPVYNAKLYIEECVESILAQTYKDFEVLLIDNGSADNSFELCQQLAMKDDRIKAFREEVNQGVSMARNQGIGVAKGEFVTFVDADDWLEPDCLGLMVEAAQQFDAPLVLCRYKKSFEADRVQFFSKLAEMGNDVLLEEKKDTEVKEFLTEPGCKRTNKAKAVLYPTEFFLQELFFQGNTHCWGVLYKTSLLKQNNILFPRGLTIGEDMLFFTDCVLNAGEIVVADFIGYHYFINEKGAMERKFQRSYMDQITCWQQAYEKLLPVFPQLKDRLEATILVSVMLVVGKLAQLSKVERKAFEKELQYCSTVLMEYYENQSLYSFLPEGYNWKIRFFKNFPKLYLMAYGGLRKLMSLSKT